MYSSTNHKRMYIQAEIQKTISPEKLLTGGNATIIPSLKVPMGIGIVLGSSGQVMFQETQFKRQ